MKDKMKIVCFCNLAINKMKPDGNFMEQIEKNELDNGNFKKYAKYMASNLSKDL